MELTNLLRGAYSLINQSSLLESPWMRRQFARAYFFYKRHLWASYPGLTRSRPELFSDGHILDIGANIGFTATVFAKAAVTPFKVYAFEPDQANFAMLSETIKAAGCQNKVVPVRAAVGQYDGQVELWRNPTSHADHRIFTQGFKGTVPDVKADIVTVPLVSVDSFLARENLRPSPCFVKICVQGYELPVCLGLQHTLETNPGLSVTFPYAPTVMRDMGFNPEELIELFRSRGFSFYAIGDRGELYPLRDTRSGLTDIGPRIYLQLLLTRRRLVV